MKVASAAVSLSSVRATQQQRTVSESIEAWRGAAPPSVFSDEPAPGADSLVSLSPELADNTESQGVSSSLEESDTALSPRWQLIRAMLEALTGHEIRLADVRTMNAESGGGRVETPLSSSSAQAGSGLVYERHEAYQESEATAFSAEGVVQTSDGREIRFQLDLVMQRQYESEQHVELRYGDAAKPKDPLILNFTGTAAELTDTRFSFDLNADGQKEAMPLLKSGSGFLVFDRNRDGTVNDGRELFGPQTQNGFTELAQLDRDANGWIDEADPAFAQLGVWVLGADGQPVLQSLKDRGVGALALAHVGTEFSLKNAANQLLGQVRSSGVFLEENGRVGALQQVDLNV